MPESPESWIAFMLCLLFYNYLAALNTLVNVFVIYNLWADPTEKEIKAAPKDSRIGKGLVYKLGPTSTIMRGQIHSQRPLYPPSLKKTKTSIEDAGLCLKGVHYAARNVIFDLGTIWFQVRDDICLL